ncbi:hypothetical protein CP556_20640 [Natrinema sp. CBA1119]|uniref:hypothetical protein n=1 Tax=Natrinema sp. CBA1119 TaxID=1608465 RepID=UPI000BF448B8|nr:hypothetical protein [Natrinema sp. CBA1119]PGF14643.1 hypothetical protein CP556_20640 [Natrinema sp. CBA1119]
MTGSLVAGIWDDLFEQVGDDLRVVTRYKPTEFDTKMRDDVRAKYTCEEDRIVVDDTIVKQLGLDDTEEAFKTGDLHALVRVFDDAWILSWTDDLPKKSGLMISIQRDGATASMDDLEWCIQYLDTEIALLVD